MTLDIRIPLGLVFTIIGCLLEGYGLIGDPARRLVSLGGMEIDRTWGALLIVFGIGMLMLAFWCAQRDRRFADAPGEPRSGIKS